MKDIVIPLLAFLLAIGLGYYLASGDVGLSSCSSSTGSSVSSAGSSGAASDSSEDADDPKSSEGSEGSDSEEPVAPSETSYTVEYLSESGEEIAPAKEVTGVVPGESVTEQAISVAGYELVSDSSQTVVPNSAGTTVVYFYYVEAVPEPEEGQGLASQGDYVLPNSDVRTYQTSDLENLSTHDLFLAREELFARYGAAFSGSEAADESYRYFSTKSWYHPTLSDYPVSILNPIELGNAYAIQRIERARDSSYVGILSNERRNLYQNYYRIASEYQSRYGVANVSIADGKYQMEGLCLAQLIDLQKDDWEELLLVYQSTPGFYSYDVVDESGAVVTSGSSGAFSLSGQDVEGIALKNEGSRWSVLNQPSGSFNYYLTSPTGRSSERYSLYPLDLQTVTDETIRTLKTA